MSAIECTTAGVKDMADGSLRITFEFDPRHAKDAFLLFGSRGTACAIVALTQAASKQAAQAEIIEADKPKGGALSKLAAMWCQDARFYDFLNTCGVGLNINSAIDGRYAIYEICDIGSRADLDNNQAAAEKFHRFIREPYKKYLANLD